jgi:hypothetical protein
MVSTRVDTAKLKLAVDKAAKKIDEANDVLAPYLLVLSDQERAKIARTRDGFDEATRSLARGIEGHANVIAATDFDGEAVIEDLDNIKILTPMLEKTMELNQRIIDSQLVWRGEAWVPALLAYGVAKVLSRTNAALRSVVDPLAAVFATHRTRAAKPVDPTEKK